MRNNIVVVVPFLFVEGILAFAVFMFLQVDWLVNHTLYSYNLTFSFDWAVPYWAFLRMGLALLGLAMASVGVFGYRAYRRAERLSLMPVYVCRSCGNILTSSWEVMESAGRSSTNIKTIKSCPKCNKELLEE